MASTCWLCLLAELQALQPQIEVDVAQVLTLRGSLNTRNVLGGTAPGQARLQIELPTEKISTDSPTQPAAESPMRRAPMAKKTQCSSNPMASATPVAALLSGIAMELAAKGGRNIAMHTTAATSAGVDAVSARCSVLLFMGCSGAEGQAPV